MSGARTCPVCRRPIVEDAGSARYRPFCSKRCADVDLGRWLKGAYAIPASETDDESESDEAALPEEDADAHAPPRPTQ